MASTAQILFLLLVAAAVQCHGAHRYYRGRSHGRYRNPHDYYHHRRHSGETNPYEMKHNRHQQEDSDEPPVSHPQNSRKATLLNGDVTGLVPNNIGASIGINPPAPADNAQPDSDNSVANPGLNVASTTNGDKPDDVANIKVDGLSPKDEKPNHINDSNKPDGENGAGIIKVDDMPPFDSNDLPVGGGTINVNGLSPGGDLNGSLGGNIDGDLPNTNLEEPTGSINVNGLEPGNTHGSPSGEVNNELDQDDNKKSVNGHSSNQDEDKPDQDDKTIQVDGLSPNDNDGEITVNGLSSEGTDYEPDNGGDTINVDGLSPGGDDKIFGDHSMNIHDGKPNDDTNIKINGLSPGEADVNLHGNNEHERLPSDDLGKPNHNNEDAHVSTHSNPDNYVIHKPDISNVNNGGLPSGDGLIGEQVDMPVKTGHISDYGDTHPKPNYEPSGDLSGQPNFPGDDILPYPTVIPGQQENIPIELPNEVYDKDVNVKNNSLLIPVQIPGGGHILVQPSALYNIPSYVIVTINGQPTLIQNPDIPHGLPVGGAVLPNWTHLPVWIGSQQTSGQFLIPNNEPVEPVPVEPVPVPVPRPIEPPRPIITAPIPEPSPDYNIPYPGYYWPTLWNAGLTPSNPNLQKLVDLLINISSRLPKAQPPLPMPPPRPIIPTPHYPAYLYPQYPSYPYPPRFTYQPLPYLPKYPVPSTKLPVLNLTAERDDDFRPTVHEPLPENPLVFVQKPRPELQPEQRPEVKPEIHPKPKQEPQQELKPEIHQEVEPEIHQEFKPETRPEVKPETHREPKPENRPVVKPETYPDVKPEIHREPKPETRPEPKPETRPEPKPEIRPEVKPEARPEVKPEIHQELKPEPRPESKSESRPEPHREPRPESKHEGPHIHITLPKPSHVGKLKPSQPGLDSGLVDILNILLKFPDRNSHPPKNLEPIIKLLLSILKPGDKIQSLIPNLNEEIKGQPDLGNLGHILLHILDGRKEPNLNVLVEPGMDEATRGNLILLLNLLANNLGGSYPDMGYYQPGNPLLYFLGHFPCDHPNIPAISGMQSRSNLWQLLANLYGHNLGRSEFRLERSAEEIDDRPVEPAKDSQKI